MIGSIMIKRENASASIWTGTRTISRWAGRKEEAQTPGCGGLGTLHNGHDGIEGVRLPYKRLYRHRRRSKGIRKEGTSFKNFPILQPVFTEQIEKRKRVRHGGVMEVG